MKSHHLRCFLPLWMLVLTGTSITSAQDAKRYTIWAESIEPTVAKLMGEK